MLTSLKISRPWLVLAVLVVLGFGLLAPSQGRAATTVASDYGTQAYIDSGTSNPTLDGFYVGYTITSSTAQSDVWVTIGSFSGGVVALAPNAASTVHLGAMAAGASLPAFFYLQASGATASAQQQTITVYNGKPNAGGVLLTSASESLTVATTISANANKVTSETVSAVSPELGGSFTVTVQGQTGTIGSPPLYWFTPAADVKLPGVGVSADGDEHRL
jgi:hypothetical protein